MVCFFGQHEPPFSRPSIEMWLLVPLGWIEVYAKRMCFAIIFQDSGAPSALAKLTNRLNFLKERRAILASEMQNLDLARPPGPPAPAPKRDSTWEVRILTWHHYQATELCTVWSQMWAMHIWWTLHKLFHSCFGRWGLGMMYIVSCNITRCCSVWDASSCEKKRLVVVFT